MQRNFPCQTSFLCVSAQKNTHYLLVFDSLVIAVCLTSAVLCARSMLLAIKLLQVTCPSFLNSLSFSSCFKSIACAHVSHIGWKIVPVLLTPFHTLV